MNERATLKKSRNFYGETEFKELENESNYNEMDEEELNDEIAVQEMVKGLVSQQVKEYCTEHFEEIIAAAIMLHDAKQKRKLVKAAKQNKCH